MARLRLILATYPAQGHINPTLQFSKRLAAATYGGADITFIVPLYAYRRISKGHDSIKIETSNGSVISFAAFSVDGYNDGYNSRVGDRRHYHSEISRCGTQAITDLVVSARVEDRPYSFLVYTLLLPWAGLAADHLGLPSAMLWIQPAMVFAIYYHYFFGYGDTIREVFSKKESCLKTTLPGLSLELKRQDLPSFMDQEEEYLWAMKIFEEQFDLIIRTRNEKRILVNSFDDLETEALGGVSGVSLIGIGPLIPSAFLDEKNDLSDKSFNGDLFDRPNDNYMEWLNSKPKTTVVYVSFGSVLDLPKQQMEEIAKGLLDFGRPFLWVVRKEIQKDDGGELSCREELEKLGMIVPWCSQVEVLCSEAVGCFVSHCGWNSTLESLASGVPVVAFPRWSDQGTNAKLIEDVWRTGVRVRPDEDGIVASEEIRRCLELVMGGKENEKESWKESRVEMRRNARKWKDLARKATKEGGSSDKNLKYFVAEMIHSL